MIRFFSLLVLGFTLSMQLVVWTALLLRLIMTMAPFRLCRCLSARTRWLPLCRRRLTEGLLRTQSMFTRFVLTRAVRWTCRVLLLESAVEVCVSARQLRFMLIRKCRCLMTLPMTCLLTNLRCLASSSAWKNLSDLW